MRLDFLNGRHVFLELGEALWHVGVGAVVVREVVTSELPGLSGVTSKGTAQCDALALSEGKACIIRAARDSVEDCGGNGHRRCAMKLVERRRCGRTRL